MIHHTTNNLVGIYMAKEMMRFTQSQVLQQAGISMLSQANQLPSAILQLLQ
jgi:flagellin